MGKIEFDRSQIEAVTQKVVERTMRMDLTWDWPCGVAYYGVAEAYEATKKEEYLDALQERVDELIELGLPGLTVNTCAMGHVLLTLYKYREKPVYKEIMEMQIDYLENHALRFGENVLQHTVSAKNDFPEQCWADTLFMAALFLLRAGVALKRSELVTDALNQWYWHIQYLQDEKTGLWYHGYDNLAKDHMSGFFWGRANCWAAYTMSQVSHLLPECYLYPEYLEITGSLNEQLSALKLLQTEQGLWRTILDDEESYEELSASAGIAAAMVAKKNPLYLKYVKKSLQGLLNHITEDGRVTDVSGGTAVMKDREGYRNISKKWIQGWGQGMALAFLSSLLKMDQMQGDGAL